jgi:hypothetical protein
MHINKYTLPIESNCNTVKDDQVRQLAQTSLNGLPKRCYSFSPIGRLVMTNGQQRTVLLVM